VTETKEAGAGDCPSGLYQIDAAQRARILGGDAFPASFALAVLNGETAGTRVGFFCAIAKAFHFPDYFGHNWDAVYDCLTDMSWLTADGFVLVLDRFDRFAANEPEQWQIAMKVLQDACAFWRPLARPFLVLFDCSEHTVPVLPALPERCLAAGSHRAAR
jgi:RNAse (barnase) inhibitor barstar